MTDRAKPSWPRHGIGMLAAMLASACVGTAPVADTAPITADRAGAPAPAGSVEQFLIAEKLARWGIANDDAVALIAAARIKTRLGARLLEAGTSPTEAGRDVRLETTVAALLERAMAMAPDDEQLQALIADSRNQRVRGRLKGPMQQVRTLDGGDVHTHSGMVFRKRTLAEAAVIGDGDSDLDLYIHDADGRLLCADENDTDRAYCRWIPRDRAAHTITVRNRGGSRNGYQLVTN